MNSKPLLLIIDDEPAILQTLKDALEDEHYRIITLSEAQRAIECVGDLVPDVILLDIFMPNCNGLDLLEQIKKEFPQQKVIIISGYGNIAIALDAIKKGAVDFIEKPLNLDEILSKISQITALPTQMADNQKKMVTDDFKKKGLIGESPLFFELMNHVQMISSLKQPLLIYGSVGTGKTLTAKYIHHCEPWINLPFFIFNCPIVGNDFYHELISKVGVFFLKNINDLSMPHQKDLLCFLNSDEYIKKNAQGLIKIIASSSQSLLALSLEQKFNHSLFCKLNLTPIELVSLNKRRYDIPLLCNHFLEFFNNLYNKKISFSASGIRFLRNHNWTDNITELRLCIDTVVARSIQTECTIDAIYLQQIFHEKNIHFIEEQAFLYFDSLKEATENFERNFLTYTIKKNCFNIEAASDKLKISLLELQKKISKLKIQYR